MGRYSVFPHQLLCLQLLGAHLEVNPECPSAMLCPPALSALSAHSVQMIFLPKEPREIFRDRCYQRGLGDEVTFTRRHSRVSLPFQSVLMTALVITTDSEPAFLSRPPCSGVGQPPTASVLVDIRTSSLCFPAGSALSLDINEEPHHPASRQAL